MPDDTSANGTLPSPPNSTTVDPSYLRAVFNGAQLRVAKLIGDDFQQHASGRVVDSAMWTRGSSEQRQRWVKIGFDSGRPADCDTFAASYL